MTKFDHCRMESLARLPVFLALAGKRAVVAGDSPAAAWKAELLSAAGAAVDVFAPRPTAELQALAGDPPGGAIAVIARAWREDDLAGAAIAVGDCRNDNEAERFAAAAGAAGVPVNVIDKPDYCDFSFGAIVNRSPLVIGISTNGAAPMFSQVIRGRLEAMIPLGFARWVAAAKRWRDALQIAALSHAGRRKFWQAFAGLALKQPDRPPAQRDFATLLSLTQSASAAADAGSVTMVDAGPGDPQLLTLRAVRALQTADVILIDAGVAPDVLDFARREAKKMRIGKAVNGGSASHDDGGAQLLALAKSGRHVVWLKAGDAVDDADNGDIVACRQAGIPVEIVPGVSATPRATAGLERSSSEPQDAALTARHPRR
jgi:uroporphyrin-III C-methyltransferase/precorrin-2 dehydrogenase/sirohydrochlorin ferrochelatase